MTIGIAINGYGTIGKRVADAFSKHPSFEVIGIAKSRPDYGALIAYSKGYKIYTLKENIELFRSKGLEVEGSIEDMVEKADLVIDTTPGGIGRKYIELYREYGKPAVFQGGEKPDIVEASYNTFCNYDEVYGLKYVRVVSCNTTGLLRLICILDQEYGVEKVRATIIRRGADPKEDKRGPINSIRLDPAEIPSHHALDVKTVVKNLDIETIALVIPTTLMHLHVVKIFLKNYVKRDDVLDLLSRYKRFILIDGEKTGITSTAKIIEASRDLGRNRYDLPENIIWSNMLRINDRELTVVQAIHQESIVIPENLDVVHAMLKLEKDSWSVVKKTDELLGLGSFL